MVNTFFFNASRMGTASSALFPVRIFPQLYKVSIEGEREAEMLLTITALNAQYDRAGNRILYEDLKGYEDPWRKHETFSVAHDISDDGEMLAYLAKSANGHELWSAKIRDRELKRLCEIEAPTLRGPGSPSILKLDKDGKNAFLLVAGIMLKVKLDDGKAEPVKFNAEKEINGAAERFLSL
jgi:hypothetical protein